MFTVTSHRSSFLKMNVFFTFTIKVLIFISIIFLFFIQTVQADSVTLAWDANSESDIAGYKIYYGRSSRNYTNCIDVGKRTSYTVSGIQMGLTYYFATTAYDADGYESYYSNEVIVGSGGGSAGASSGGGGGCFVDTATCGASPANTIKILKYLRKDHSLK
jgi:fibronectin type 3 domain-containing protein